MPRIAIAVEDFPSVISMFRDKLDMPVLDISTRSVPDLGARLAMCVPEGGSNIEIMSPANPDTPLSQSLQRFIDRRGEGHFALMLEAADPDAEAEGLLKRGLNVLTKMEGAGGRDVHPNSAHGVLIRVYPVASYVGKAPDYVASPDGPGLTGIRRAIIAVKDLDAAIATYGTKFAMEVSEADTDEKRGVRSAICTPPAGGVIELMAVSNPGPPLAQALKRFLGARGEGLYVLILGSNDQKKTVAALAAKGVGVAPVAGLDQMLEIDPDVMFGTRFWIEPIDAGAPQPRAGRYFSNASGRVTRASSQERVSGAAALHTSLWAALAFWPSRPSIRGKVPSWFWINPVRNGTTGTR
jgi:catechol 2,3-dioxygenase-like lactoylglutathione lyase family enzyme